MRYKREYLDKIRSDISYFKIFFRKIHHVEIVQIHSMKYVASCCLHKEKTPSFVIYKKGNLWFYKCFGCGFGGDIFKLIMETGSAKTQIKNEFGSSENAVLFRAAVRYAEIYLEEKNDVVQLSLGMTLPT